MSEEIVLAMELSKEDATSLELAQVLTKIKWLIANAKLEGKQKANLKNILAGVELGEHKYDKKKLWKNLMHMQKELDPEAEVRNRGDVVFPADSKNVTDKKDHFPINSIEQARNALARAGQYKGVPPWFTGTLEELKAAIEAAVKAKFPSIEVGGANEMADVSLQELYDLLMEILSEIKGSLRPEEMASDHPMVSDLLEIIHMLPEGTPARVRLEAAVDKMKKMPMEMFELLELNSELLSNLDVKESEIMEMKNAMELSDISMAMEASEQLKKAAFEITKLSTDNTDLKSKIETHNSQLTSLQKQIEEKAKQMSNVEAELNTFKSAEEKRILAEKQMLVGEVLELSKSIGESFTQADFKDYNTKQLSQFKEVLALKAESKKTPVRQTVKNVEPVNTKKKLTDKEKAELLFFGK